MNKSRLLFLTIFLISCWAEAQHKGINFQAVLKKPDGSYPTISGLTVTLQILDPNNDCVLREEQHAGINVANGYINLVIGSPTATTPIGRNPTPVLSVTEVMNNSVTRNGLNCVDGNNNIIAVAQTYVPTAVHQRKLRLRANLSGDQVVADFNMRAVAFAVNSEMLNGKTEADFINTTTDVTQARANALFAPAVYDNLLNLSSSSTGALLIPAGTTAQRPGIASMGMIRFNDTNNRVEFHDGTGWVELATGTTAGETNTASNVGAAGVGIYKQKTGVDLEFKNINAGSNKISVANDAANNEVDIDVNVSNLGVVENLGFTPSIKAVGSAAFPAETATGSGRLVVVTDTSRIYRDGGAGTWNMLTSLNFADITNKPTTLGGYGITDSVGTSDARLLPAPAVGDALKIPRLNAGGTAYELITGANFLTAQLPNQATHAGKFLSTDGAGNLSWGSAGAGDMVLASSQTVTGAKSFNANTLLLNGSTSGATTLNAAAIAGTGTVTLPTSGTLATLDGTETLTNKTLTSPVLTTPTVTTSLTTPLILGGTSTTQTLTYRTTSGVGAAGADHIFQVGNDGATEAMRILNSGDIVFGAGKNLTMTAGSGTLNIASGGIVGPATGFTVTQGASGSGAISIATTNHQHITLMPHGNGRVGIRNSNPQAVLDVNGNIYSNGSVISASSLVGGWGPGANTANINNRKLGVGTQSSTPYVSSSAAISSPGSTGGGGLIVINTQSGADDISSVQDFLVKNAAGNDQFAYIGAVSTSGAGSYSPSIVIGQRTGANAYTERLRVSGSGNVGIGTDAPDTKLHVVGTSGTTLKIVDGNQAAGRVLTSDANGVASWAAPTGTGDFLRNGSVSMTGAFKAIDGTQAAPGIAFDTEAGTGFYKSAAGTVTFSGGGSGGWHFTNGSITGFGGQGAQILNSSGGGLLTYRFVNDNNTGISNPAADNLGFTTGGTERIRIDSAGNVGVGTSSPASLLHIDGSAATQILGGTAGAATLAMGNRDSVSATLNGGAGAYTGIQSANGNLAFGLVGQATPGTVYQTNMMITSDGSVGIGTSTPAYKTEIITAGANGLSIKSRANAGWAPSDLYFWRTDAAGTGSVPDGSVLGQILGKTLNSSNAESTPTAITFTQNTKSATGVSGDIGFHTSDGTSTGPTERMRISPQGNVGIGTTAPNASSILELQSTDKGFLLPRMTTAQRTAIASPAAGLIVFDTTENLLYIYKSGAWSKVSDTSQVAFRARKTANQTLTLNTFTALTYDTEDFDTGNNFAANTFTAPVSGYYQFNGGGQIWNQSGGADFTGSYVRFVKNGAGDDSTRAGINVAGNLSTSTYKTSALIYLNANDTVSFEAFYSAGSGITVVAQGGLNSFEGFLVAGGTGGGGALTNNSVNSTHILDATITGTDIANNTIGYNNLTFASTNGITMPSLASDPGTPSAGQMYFNTTSNSIKVYNGSTWTDLSSGGGTNNTMKSGFPDAIACNTSTGERTLYLANSDLTLGVNSYYNYVEPWGSLGWIQFYASNGNLKTYDNVNYASLGACNTSISGIYAAGRAFNFAKGPVGQWLQSGSNAYYNAGLVGIGTSTPTNTLNLYSTTSTFGLTVDGSTNPAITMKSGGTLRGYIGVPTSGGGYITGSAAGDMTLTATTGKILMSTNGVAGSHLTIDTSGNVGVGTTSPTFKLEVSGAANDGKMRITQTTNTNSASLYLRNDVGTTAELAQFGSTAAGGSRGAWIQNGTEAITVNNSANVGIGTTSPAARLEVSTTGSVLRGIDVNDTTNTVNFTALLVKSAGVSQGSITASAAGSVSYNTTSDRRRKENIAPTEDGLEKLLQIQVRDFSLITDPKKEIHQGFIAQELVEVYPDAVTKQPGDDGTKPLSLKELPWSVDYGRLTPLIVKAVQDLYKVVKEMLGFVDEAQREISSLKDEVDELKKQNSQMRDYICSKDPEAPICK